MSSKGPPLNFLRKIESVIRLLAETEGGGVKLRQRPSTPETTTPKLIPTYFVSKIINKILRVLDNVEFESPQAFYVGLRSRKERSLGLDERFERLQSAIPNKLYRVVVVVVSLGSVLQEKKKDIRLGARIIHWGLVVVCIE